MTLVTPLDGLLCLLLLLLLLLDHILLIDFEVGVIADFGEKPGPRLAMLDDQMAHQPITGMEPEPWV